MYSAHTRLRELRGECEMKLEVSKRDAYIMAETLWEAAMDLDIAA